MPAKMPSGGECLCLHLSDHSDRWEAKRVGLHTCCLRSGHTVLRPSQPYPQFLCKTFLLMKMSRREKRKGWKWNMKGSGAE